MAPGRSAQDEASRRASWSTRLSRRLARESPVAALYGIYLGTRVDLLPALACQELLAIPDRGEASAADRVDELLRRDLGLGSEELFEDFDGCPFDSGLVHQWHRARLRDGREAVVQVVHPELEAERAPGRLEVLERRLIGSGDLPRRARGTASVFRTSLDLRRSAVMLARLAEEAADSPRVAVPEVASSLGSPGILVTIAAGADPVRDDEKAPAAVERLFRRRVRAWLTLALRGGLFPVEPWGRKVGHLENGRVLFGGAEIDRLPRSLLSDLSEYLAAVAAGESARAARAFTRLLPGAPYARRLRFRLRHAEPFREHGLDIGGDRLVRQLLAHRLAAEQLGYQPDPALAPFYRGLFLLNQEGRELVPPVTAIRDGFREARLLLLLETVRREVGEQGLAVIERQLELVTVLPSKLDRIVTLAAESEEGHGDPAESVPVGFRAARPLARRFAGVLLAIGAVVLLTRYLGDGGTFGVWAERAGGLLVLTLGGLLLSSATRSGGGD